VQVLRGGAHVQRGRVDQLVGQESRVRVGALGHRVVAHVLDAAGDGDVVRADGDAGRDGGDGRHRTCAHPVDGEAGHALGQAGQDGAGPPDGQALITGLGGRGDRDLVDPLRRQVRLAAQQLPDHLDDHVVGPGLRVLPLVAGLAERGAHALDEHHVAQGARARWYRAGLRCRCRR